MANPIPAFPALANLRPPNDGTWNCDFAQVVSQAPAGTQTFVHRVGVQTYVVAGRVVGGQPPQPQDIVNAMIHNGTAHEVYYMEIWETDNTILGTGWDTFWYISVYR